MEIKEELELVEQSKKDIKAFDKLYRYFLPKVYGYCINRLPNKSLAEEITSLVFYEAVNQITKFNTKRGISFGSWLYKVAHNKIVDFFRKNKNSKVIDLDNLESGYDENHDESIILFENQKIVANVLSKIHPRYQEVISLRYFSELTNDEISTVTGNKDVALIMHRALKAFKERFEKIYPKSEIFDLF